MSVQSETSQIAYVGNNSTATPYPVPFLFFENAHVVATVKDSAGAETPLSQGADYSITGEGNPSGGAIVTTAAWDSTHTITIYRQVPITQTAEYEEGGSFPAATHERALDKLTMVSQQVNRAIGLSLRFRESDGLTPPIDKIPSTLLSIDALGLPVCRTADEVKSWLSLAAPILNYPTKTWADAAERALAVPEFVGQVGAQRDDRSLWTASGLSAGSWVAALQAPGIDTVETAMLKDGILSADAAGRGKMADGFFSADAAGRGKFDNGFLTDSLLAAILDLSGKTLTMPSGHWRDIAPAGAVLQTVIAEVRTNATLSPGIPMDDTIPQSTEGTQVVTASITPSNAANKILVKSHFMGSGNQAGYTAIMAMFRDSASDAFAVSSTITGANGYMFSCDSVFLDAPNTTSAVTYKMRAGNNSTTLAMNGSTGGRIFGGASSCHIVLQEIKG